MFVWGGDDDECSAAIVVIIVTMLLEVMNVKVCERKRTNENNNGNNYDNSKLQLAIYIIEVWSCLPPLWILRRHSATTTSY